MNMKCIIDPKTSKFFYTLLSEKRDAVLTRWGEHRNIQELIQRLNLSKEEHQKSIAVPVLDNLIHMLKNAEIPPDCPIMRELIESFYNRGLTVEDVFLNCTGLKNVIILLIIEKQYTHMDISPLIDMLDMNLYHVLSIYTDKLKEHEKELQMHNRIIEEHVVLTITNTDGKIIYVTDAFCDLTGYSKEELMGSDHSIIRHPEMKDSLFRGMWKRIKAGKTWYGKIKNRKKEGGEFIASTEIIPVKDENDNIIEYMAIRNDITDKELSGLDPLTGLFNRRRLDTLMEEHVAKDDLLTLMVIDIDHFKVINDTFGHQKGDTVLKKFAGILTQGVRPQDICARWGGEEFVILLPGTSADIAHTVAERIRTITETAQILEKHPVRCTIGLTQMRPSDTVKTLFQRADSLLYNGKKSGRNRTMTDYNHRDL
jgi:diguanylate cyclase (GGDEF)-like protein/PAS domain S-box-containing protein